MEKDEEGSKTFLLIRQTQMLAHLLIKMESIVEMLNEQYESVFSSPNESMKVQDAQEVFSQSNASA